MNEILNQNSQKGSRLARMAPHPRARDLIRYAKTAADWYPRLVFRHRVSISMETYSTYAHPPSEGFTSHTRSSAEDEDAGFS